MVPNMKFIVNMSPHSLNTIIESYVDLNFLMLAIVLDNSGEEKRVSQPSSSI